MRRNPPISKEEQEARRPLPPEVLAGSDQSLSDDLPNKSCVVRRGRSVRLKGERNA